MICADELPRLQGGIAYGVLVDAHAFLVALDKSFEIATFCYVLDSDWCHAVSAVSLSCD